MRAMMACVTTLCWTVIALGSAAESRLPTAQADDKTNTKITGPYIHLNLSVFLIHGPDQIKQKRFLTLSEALASKRAIVHETNKVEELAVENVSSEDILIQAGDIVKGGRQDRILAVDLIVPSRKGKQTTKVPIASFCCESGRWRQRGHEDVSRFATGNDQAPTNDLKIAIRKEKSQESVWRNVAKAQSGLGSGLGGGGFAGMGGTFQSPAVGVAGQVGGPLNDIASPSSLQLSLENRRLKLVSNTYVAKLKSAPQRHHDVIGCVVAVNGQITGAEVYVSNAMFKKVWPNLLNASTVEAIAKWDAKAKPQTVSVELAREFLRQIDAGERATTDISQRVRLVQRETDGGILFETRDQENDGAVIRRSYLAKPPKGE